MALVVLGLNCVTVADFVASDSLFLMMMMAEEQSSRRVDNQELYPELLWGSASLSYGMAATAI